MPAVSYSAWNLGTKLIRLATSWKQIIFRLMLEYVISVPFFKFFGETTFAATEQNKQNRSSLLKLKQQLFCKTNADQSTK